MTLDTVEIPTGFSEPVKARQITQGKYAEASPVWSKDESQIYFTSDRAPEPYYEPPRTDIYSVATGGGGIRKLAHVDGMASGLSLSPDGKRVAFVGALNGNPERSYNQPDIVRRLPHARLDAEEPDRRVRFRYWRRHRRGPGASARRLSIASLLERR